MEDLEGFVDTLATQGVAFAIWWLVENKAKPVFEPLLKKRGLAWSDVMLVFDKAEEVREAMSGPEEFLDGLLDAARVTGTDAARKWLIAKAKPHIEPMLKVHCTFTAYYLLLTTYYLLLTTYYLLLLLLTTYYLLLILRCTTSAYPFSRLPRASLA